MNASIGWTIVGICIVLSIVGLLGWCEDKFSDLDDEESRDE